MKIRAIVALRTKSVFGEFLTFSLVAEVERVRELTCVALFAQAPLVVFADEVSYSRSLFLWDVVSIGAVGAARTLVLDEVLTYWACDLGGCAEGGKSLFEVVVESEGRGGEVLGMEHQVGGRVLRFGGGHCDIVELSRLEPLLCAVTITSCLYTSVCVKAH